MQQTFPAGSAHSISIEQIHDDVRIYGWDQQTIQVFTEGQPTTLEVIENVLIVQGNREKIEIAAPYESIVQGKNINGSVKIDGIQEVSLLDITGDVTIGVIQNSVKLYRIQGDISLENIRGKAQVEMVQGDVNIAHSASIFATGKILGSVEVSNVDEINIQHVNKDLTVKDSTQLKVGKVKHDLIIERVPVIHGGYVGKDCQIAGSSDTKIILGHVGSDLNVSGAASLQAGNVGHDLQIRESAQAAITFGNVGHEANIVGAAGVNFGNVGHECTLRDIQGEAQMGNVGHDLFCKGVSGNIKAGNIGGDASIKGGTGNTKIGMIGGSIILERTFPAGSTTKINAGKEIHLMLPEWANTQLDAKVGGMIRGIEQVEGYTPSSRSLQITYGEGAAVIHLKAGKDLTIQAQEAPVSVNSNNQYDNGYWWEDFAPEMEGIGTEWNTAFAEMAANFEQGWGNEWGPMFAEMSANFEQDFGKKSREYAQKAEEKADELRRKAEEKAENLRRKAEERARRQQHKQNRYDRNEWNINPEKINQIIEQAHQATVEGIYGAQEAVEQALKNWNIEAPMPPYTPKTNTNVGFRQARDTDDRKQQATDERNQPEVPVSFAEKENAINIEQEREAILHMIAENRITPEEGDMLLEALGN